MTINENKDIQVSLTSSEERMCYFAAKKGPGSAYSEFLGPIFSWLQCYAARNILVA